MAKKPIKATVRTYRVGFGDCFLLSFSYADGDARHVLIDFGSTALPRFADKDLLRQVAEDIKRRTAGKLHVVVATHRHRDHISGFATATSGKGSGDIIASLKPEVVLQPWTEDPDIPEDATFSPKAKGKAAAAAAFRGGLAAMHAVSEHALREATRARNLSKSVRKQLAFLGEDNLKNLSAVKNLQAMGKKGKAVFARYGTKVAALRSVLPGVTVRVLGPPDLTQTEAIRKQRSKDPTEFWHVAALGLKALDGRGAPAGLRGRPIPLPSQARWFRKRLDAARGEQLLALVRALDEQMNNTSLILLFQAGTKKLLFPGDAQIENWRYALTEAKTAAANRRLLSSVDLYKVGHHGSLNATPKTLWNGFKRRGKANAPRRLSTVVSTLSGQHGHADRGTEVPRSVLMEALTKESTLLSSQDIKKAEKFRDLEVKL